MFFEENLIEVFKFQNCVFQDPDIFSGFAYGFFVAAFVFHLAINGDPAKVWEKAFLYMVIFFFLSLAGSGDFALEKVLKIKRKW